MHLYVFEQSYKHQIVTGIKSRNASQMVIRQNLAFLSFLMSGNKSMSVKCFGFVSCDFC